MNYDAHGLKEYLVTKIIDDHSCRAAEPLLNSGDSGSLATESFLYHFLNRVSLVDVLVMALVVEKSASDVVRLSEEDLAALSTMDLGWGAIGMEEAKALGEAVSKAAEVDRVLYTLERIEGKAVKVLEKLHVRNEVVIE